jgi:hypothetical protein
LETNFWIGEFLAYAREGVDNGIVLSGLGDSTMLKNCKERHKTVYDDIKKLIDRQRDMRI